MAGGGGGGGGEWEVDFSRFFNCPRPSAKASGLLNPLPRIAKTRSKGTWVSAAGPAVLRLTRPRSATAPVLSVSLSGFLAEEHSVCNLNISWPQVSCVPQCPIRGSRALFLSYRNSSGQIQKFAVRFPTSCAAETFVNSVKECSRDSMNVQPPGRDILCENSSPSEFVDSNGLHHRFHEEPRFEVPVATRAPDIPALTYGGDLPGIPIQPFLANNMETISSGLPPSFTELLNNCSTDMEREQSTASRAETNCTLQNEGYTQNPSFHSEEPSVPDATELPEIAEGIAFRAQIAKYMSDASFHGMLFKIEKVIDELGGDLSL